MDICAEAYADALVFDFASGDELPGGCTKLREFLEERTQSYVLRVASNVTLALPGGTKLNCKEAVRKMARDRNWEVGSAGMVSKGERWYAWAWISPPRRAITCWSPAICGRRDGFPLLLSARRPAAYQDQADQSGRVAARW
jgi:hypothetical protein